MKNKGLVFSLLAMILSACATPEILDNQIALETPPPTWIVSPPQEEGFLFGIGVDDNPSDARSKSIINAGQQYSSHIQSAFEEKNLESSDESRTVLSRINEQVTNQTVRGAKFYDEYKDGEGNHWVLSRAPLNCILDVTEGLILSYQLELKQEIKNLNDIVEEISRPSRNLNSWKLAETGKKIPWTPRVSQGSIKVDGNSDDWVNVPVYYKGKKGDASVSGTDLDYLKVAMDDKYAYILAICEDGDWRSRVTYLMHLDYKDNPGSRFGYTDIETNFNADYTNFWDGSHNINPAYDPGGIERRKGSVFEVSIPLNRYEAQWFNILLFNVFPEGAQASEENNIPYESTWIDENEAKRRQFVDYSQTIALE
jgi:hypothetical protein